MLDSRIAEGHYARKQLGSRSALVSWSHTSRFETARRLVAPYAGARLLDYGCGDGTFLWSVHDLFPAAVGVDADEAQIDDCARRLRPWPGLSFRTTQSLTTTAAAFDVVVCMEVLEHCPDDVQAEVVEEIRRIAVPGARLVVSVPLETGPALLVKQAARAVAAARGLEEYASRERYSVAECIKALLAGPTTALTRTETIASSGDRVFRYTGHKGFNWRRLQGLLESRVRIERRLFSPLPVLGPWINSQVWFVCCVA
jgi:2-polyprenyl-3-methyl-5-hydroxy-6-metoxy-1,4-benzoquinol methylase